MNKKIHRAASRGFAEHGWLTSRHTFSFASYFNPRRMGFGVLRVLNDDIVKPAMGFDTHHHKDMEIISIPLKGTLRHQDNLGNIFVIRKGEIQVMSAGSGVEHSEYNHSLDEDVNFLQIWILPREKGLTPKYGQMTFLPVNLNGNPCRLLVSPDGRDKTLQVNQDAFISYLKLERGQSYSYLSYCADTGVYFFVISGDIEIEDTLLGERDGLALKKSLKSNLAANHEAEVLIMELPRRPHYK